MLDGWVKLWRKSLDSGWLQNGDLWRFWCYCLIKASHVHKKQIIGYQEVHLCPGQFIFGRKKTSIELKMSERKIRTCLDKLRNMQNLTIKSTSKFSIITILNWSTYQCDERQNDQQHDQHATIKRPSNDHKQECKNVRSAFTSSRTNVLEEAPASDLLARYSEPQRDRIKDCWNCIRTTRRSSKIADSIVISELEKWDKFDVRRVMYGIEKYLSGEYYQDGKKENYLYGIMRNATQKEIDGTNGKGPPINPESGPKLISDLGRRNMEAIKMARQLEEQENQNDR